MHMSNVPRPAAKETRRCQLQDRTPLRRGMPMAPTATRQWRKRQRQQQSRRWPRQLAIAAPLMELELPLAAPLMELELHGQHMQRCIRPSWWKQSLGACRLNVNMITE